MPKSLSEMLSALSAAERAEVDARYLELQQEVETLGEIRRIVGLSQQQLAETLNLKQPTLSKLERNTDMYLSTLRRYAEAVGGELKITITLPGHVPFKLTQFSDLS